MPRVIWNAPEERFFDAGLDRGMLYPRKPVTVGGVEGVNQAMNPRAVLQGSTSQEVKKNLSANPKFTPPVSNNIAYWTRTTNVAITGHPVTAINFATRFKPADLNSAAGTMAFMYNVDGLGDSATSRLFGVYVRANQPARAILYAGGNQTGTIRTVTVPANTWTWVNTIRKGTGYAYMSVERSDGTLVTAADEVLIAGVVSSQVSADRYFDGDTTDDYELTYNWVGAANSSQTVVVGLNPASWTAINNSSITRDGDGGGNYRNGINGTGFNIRSTSVATVGWHYSARFEISRIPGESTIGPVRMSIWDGDSYIAEQNGTITYFNTEYLPEDGSSVTVHLTGTAPASAAAYLYITFTTDAGAKVAFNVTNVMIQQVSLAGLRIEDRYFDGDTVSNAFEYSWSPTPYTTASTKRPRFSPAVPWNGLISVDEEGGDGAAEYYIDGRPFLYLPRPSEYKATLTAYTYPDQFAEIMGVSEVADGMYLDSQVGQVFDLCYRTRVGNAIDGVDHGFKMHLVYNATVVPQSKTYESLSDAINPTNFSWAIQAVPVSVEGFRPTAHIIIDTRHMDAKTIADVENLIYGGDDDIPLMPNPQQIFDLLSYGDTITVIANGDGTFDVIGAYENVYMIGPGEFRVDNVDGENYSDGTFRISSTNVEE